MTRARFVRNWILALGCSAEVAFAAELDLGPPVPRVAQTAPTVGQQPTGYAQRAFGLRLGATLPGVGPAPGPYASIQAYERAVGLLGWGPISARYFDELAIGGDGHGFAFAASGQASIGPRYRMTDRHSLVLRPMLRASIRQEGGVYLSSLRLPGLEAGYQYQGPNLEFDAVGHAAPLLTGVWANDTWSVPLGGSAYGVSLSTTARPLRFDLDLNWFGESASAWTVLELRGHLCALIGKKAQLPSYRSGDPRRPVHVGPRAADYSWSVCADFASIRTENSRLASEFASSWTLGISLLTGSFSLLDPAPPPRLSSARSTSVVEQIVSSERGNP